MRHKRIYVMCKSFPVAAQQQAVPCACATGHAFGASNASIHAPLDIPSCHGVVCVVCRRYGSVKKMLRAACDASGAQMVTATVTFPVRYAQTNPMHSHTTSVGHDGVEDTTSVLCWHRCMAAVSHAVWHLGLPYLGLPYLGLPVESVSHPQASVMNCTAGVPCHVGKAVANCEACSGTELLASLCTTQQDATASWGLHNEIVVCCLISESLMRAMC
jgi:hypothetical protein